MNRKNNSGFTMIELLIVVAIMAVIVALALPNYREYVIKSNRSVAKGALLEVASREEQYFLNNRSYTNSLVDLGLPANYYMGSDGQTLTTSSGSIYQITIDEPDSNTGETAYTLSATPQNSQTEDGRCGIFSIDEQGLKTVTDASESASYCW
ncbi:type IV pilin protein [Porticoccus sp.]